MNLQLVTLSGTKLDSQVYEVILPTEDGEISVFPDHEPLVTLAKSGVISVRENKTDPDSSMELYAISGGVVQIDNQLVRVLVDEADHGADINEVESKQALERAIKMQSEATSQVDLEKAHQLVDRHHVRLKVADLQRKRRNR